METEKELKEDRFFIKVITTNKNAFSKLPQYDLDLFVPTAKEDKDQFHIDGLLTISQIKLLVEDGYQVLIKRNAENDKKIATQTITFQDWLTQMKVDI